jgi:hypothetical protein
MPWAVPKGRKARQVTGVIPSECEGSKKDFSRSLSVLSGTEGVEMTNCFSLRLGVPFGSAQGRLDGRKALELVLIKILDVKI